MSRGLLRVLKRRTRSSGGNESEGEEAEEVRRKLRRLRVRDGYAASWFPHAAVHADAWLLGLLEVALLHPYDTNARRRVLPASPATAAAVAAAAAAAGLQLDTAGDVAGVGLWVPPEQLNAAYAAVRSAALQRAAGVGLPAACAPLLLRYALNACRDPAARSVVPLSNPKGAALWAAGRRVLLAAGAAVSADGATLHMPPPTAALLSALARVLLAVRCVTFSLVLHAGQAALHASFPRPDVLVLLDTRLDIAVAASQRFSMRRFWCGAQGGGQRCGHAVLVSHAAFPAAQEVLCERGVDTYTLVVRLHPGAPLLAAVSQTPPVLPPPPALLAASAPLPHPLLASSPAVGIHTLGTIPYTLSLPQSLSDTALSLSFSLPGLG